MIPTTVWIFGGRDVGKTTIAMHTVAELRWMGVPTALTHGLSRLWAEGAPIVDMKVFDRHPDTLTPHQMAELCEGSLNFLIMRPVYYWDDPPLYMLPSAALKKAWIIADKKLETTLRAGHVIYKGLPGVRASTQYLIKKICERVGYDR